MPGSTIVSPDFSRPRLRPSFAVAPVCRSHGARGLTRSGKLHLSKGGAGMRPENPTVACAGAITPAAIQEIKKMGYASIINLRLATEQGADIDANTAAAKAAGIPYYHIPFSASAPDPAVVDTFLKTITAPGVQPAFIH